MNRRDHEKIQRALDGEMEAEEFEEFQKRMREEPAVLDLYRDYALLHHSLSEEGGALNNGVGAEEEGRRFPLKFLLLLGVFGLALLFGLKWLAGLPAGADAEFSKDAVWVFHGRTIPHDGTVRLVEKGTLDLRAGEVELDYGRHGMVRLEAAVKGSVADFKKAAVKDSATKVKHFTVLPGVWTDWRWRTRQGNPTFSRGMIDGKNYAVEVALPQRMPSSEDGVLLLTVETGRSAFGEFHTDGWAGISLFSGDKEMVFFGDCFAAPATWSLDVKQAMPVIHPAREIGGPRLITLRYERKTGIVSLHEGGFPLKPAFCQGVLASKPSFDGLRIAASASAALRVNRCAILESGE